MNKQTLTPFFLSFTILSGALSLTGCEKMAEKATEKVLEEAIKADSDGEVDVDIDINDGEMVLKTDEGSISTKEDGDEVTIKSKDGNVTSVAGENVKLPDDFPKDIPLPEGIELKMAMNGDNNMFIVMGEVKGSYKGIATTMRSELDDNGWKEVIAMSEESSTGALMKKDNRALNYGITNNNGSIEVNITVNTES